MTGGIKIMKMRKFKAGCAVIAFWVLFAAVPVLAAETKKEQTADQITEEELMIEQTEPESGEQIFPPSEQLEMLEPEQLGSIQVQLTDGKNGTNKQNIRFYCTKVAEVVAGNYKLLEGFATANVELNEIENSQQMKQAAESLCQIKHQTGQSETTDESGQVLFKELSVGVYLIRAEDVEVYDMIEPTLIAIPTWSDQDQEMKYDVSIMPKHTPRSEEEDKTAPQTGLDDQRGRYILGALICFFCCGGCIWIGWKRKGKHAR